MIPVEGQVYLHGSTFQFLLNPQMLVSVVGVAGKGGE